MTDGRDSHDSHDSETADRNSRRSKARARALSRLAKEKSKRFGELVNEERERLDLEPRRPTK